MTRMTVVRRALWPALVAVCAVALVAVFLWFRATSEPRSEVIGDSPSRDGWKTVEYKGVRIDVPSSWERLDTSDCEFKFERWTRPGSDSCEYADGAAFYVSATFDPAFGPGVRRTAENGTRIWGGYAYAGDFAVYASDPDRDVVRGVLESAREVKR